MTDDSNQRGAQRKAVDATILVEDAIAERKLGRVGNLSRSGLMLIGAEPLRDDALYQLRFALPDADGQTAHMEIGVHEQWTEQASVPGQYWSGVRIIAISNDDQTRLARWLGDA